MNIVICPLVSRDLIKAIRSIESAINIFPTQYCKFEVVVIINSLNKEFVNEISNWCNEKNIKYKITPSKGTPSGGKNECLKFFLESNYDGLSMVDGDDLYYPTAGIQIEKHLLHHPGTDILIVKPSDQIISNPNNSYPIKKNVHAVCWGENILPLNYIYGPGKHPLFDNRHAATNLGGHVFYSKKLASLVKYDEDQLLGEDLLLEFELLKLHQDGKICFWLSFASDVQFLDRTEQNSVQNERNATDGEFYFDRLVKKISTFLNINRSSFNELPVEFPRLIMNYDQKIEWIHQITDKYQ